MHQIDFDYIDELGGTLYHSCIQAYLKKVRDKDHLKLTMDDTVQRTVDNLFYLIEKGDKHTQSIQQVLSRPNHIGETVFNSVYSSPWGKEIVEFMLRWKVDVNIIQLDFRTCDLLALPEYNEILLKRKMKPSI